MLLRLNQPYLGYAKGEIITVSAYRGQYWASEGVGVIVDEPASTPIESAAIEPNEAAVMQRARKRTIGRKQPGSR